MSESWARNAMQALSDAMDKVARQREEVPGITHADPRVSDVLDLSRLDPTAPGRFPGIGNADTRAIDLDKLRARRGWLGARRESSAS